MLRLLKASVPRRPSACVALLLASAVPLSYSSAQQPPPPAASVAPQASLSAPPPVASSVPQSPAASVRVSLEANDPNAALQIKTEAAARDARLAGVDGWTSVCLAPCSALVSPTSLIRVAGAGVAPSWSAALPAGKRAVYLRATTGSAATETAGLTLVLTGGGLLALGGLTLTALVRSDATKNNRPGDTSYTLEIASYTALSLGAAVFLISLPFRFAQGTQVQMTSSPSAARPFTLSPQGLLF